MAIASRSNVHSPRCHRFQTLIDDVVCDELSFSASFEQTHRTCDGYSLSYLNDTFTFARLAREAHELSLRSM
jgi:hypothetical protein